MDRSIFRTGIPAAIVAAVLGFSLLVPAAASRGNGEGDDNHGYGHKCGYGEVKDNDENDNKDGAGGGDRVNLVVRGVSTWVIRHPEKSDEDKCEDEDDDGGNGDGGGGDRTVTSTSFGSIVHVPSVAKPIVVVSNRLGSDGE